MQINLSSACIEMLSNAGLFRPLTQQDPTKNNDSLLHVQAILTTILSNPPFTILHFALPGKAEMNPV